MSQSAVGAAGIIKFGDDNYERCASCKCIGAVQHKGVKCPLFKFVPTYYLDHGEFCVMMPSVNVTTVIQPVTDSSTVVEGVEDDTFIDTAILMAIHYGRTVPSELMPSLQAQPDHVVYSDVMPLLSAHSESVIVTDLMPMLAAPSDQVVSSDLLPSLQATKSESVVL